MEPFEAVLADIAKRFEVLDVAYLNDFVGPCHPDFYAGIRKALSGDFESTSMGLPSGHSTFKLAVQRTDTCNGGSYHDESMQHVFITPTTPPPTLLIAFTE
jgi:hypothetical protein